MNGTSPIAASAYCPGGGEPEKEPATMTLKPEVAEKRTRNCQVRCGEKPGNSGAHLPPK